MHAVKLHNEGWREKERESEIVNQCRLKGFGQDFGMTALSINPPKMHLHYEINRYILYHDQHD